MGNRDPLPVSPYHPHRDQHGAALSEPCPYCARFAVACPVCGGCGYVRKAVKK